MACSDWRIELSKLLVALRKLVEVFTTKIERE